MILRAQKTWRVMGSRSKRALILACASKAPGASANAGVCINIVSSVSKAEFFLSSLRSVKRERRNRRERDRPARRCNSPRAGTGRAAPAFTTAEPSAPPVGCNAAWLRGADLGCSGSRHEAGRAQRVGDLNLGARLKRQQGGTNRCVLENPARDEAVLERNRSLHMRPAVIDGAGHREQPVMDRACLRVVLGLAGRDHFNERLGCKTAVAYQRAVHVEHRVQQILVMARQNLEIGTLAANNGNLGIPA